MLILEEYEFAKARGARIYAELVGYGMSADAYHITAPSEDGDGAFRVMSEAIEERRRRPRADVDYINAHGTSTPQGDKLETLAIKRCFGEHAKELPVSSTKSMTGHLLGAAGGLEAGITALAVYHQIAPPTINLDHPDDELRPRLRAATQPAAADRRTPCRTRSASAAPTPRCCSSDMKHDDRCTTLSHRGNSRIS